MSGLPRKWLSENTVFRGAEIHDKDGFYTCLQVGQSGAGYFIGRLYHNNEGYLEPGSRESDYFATHAEAEAALDSGEYEARVAPEVLRLYE